MRTRQEIDQEYSNTAILLGHKSRVLAQVKAEAARIEKEIEQHTAQLLELNKEGMTLPPELKVAEEVQAPAEGA